MWKVITFTALSGLAVACVAGIYSDRRRDLAEAVIRKIDLPEDAMSWMLPGHRPIPWGCLVSLGFFVGAVFAGAVEGPWLAAVGYPLGVVMLSAIVGSLLADRIRACRILRQFAIDVDLRAADLDTAGDTAAARKALDLAAWLRALCTKMPELTKAGFDVYYTPFEVAWLLEGDFFDSDDEIAIKRFLDSTDEPLDESPAETRRVAAVNRARRIIRAMGWPDTDDKRAQVRELIDELKTE
jgi:hypothetical protein